MPILDREDASEDRRIDELRRVFSGPLPSAVEDALSEIRGMGLRHKASARPVQGQYKASTRPWSDVWRHCATSIGSLL